MIYDLIRSLIPLEHCSTLNMPLNPKHSLNSMYSTFPDKITYIQKPRIGIIALELYEFKIQPRQPYLTHLVVTYKPRSKNNNSGSNNHGTIVNWRASVHPHVWHVKTRARVKMQSTYKTNTHVTANYHQYYKHNSKDSRLPCCCTVQSDLSLLPSSGRQVSRASYSSHWLSMQQAPLKRRQTSASITMCYIVKDR